MEKSPTEKISDFVDFIRSSINCQLPAKIVKINSDNTVDLEVFRNDEIENQKLIHVKIKHIENSKAFIFLGVSVGDYGVVRFFDTSVQNYVDGLNIYNYDDRRHDTNDASFELGFIPNPSSYTFPTGHDLAIGTKDGKCLITIDTGGNVVIESATSIKLGSSAAANKVLTDATVITDGEGRTCTISGPATKVFAE